MTLWSFLSTPAGGAALGLVAGLGLWLVLVRLPVMRRPTLDDRLAPYLREVAPPSRLLGRTAVGAPLLLLERLLGPAMTDAARWVERLSGGAASVRRRLDQLGGTRTVESFRAEQVLWGVAGTALGVVAALLLAARGGVAVLPLLGLVVVGAVTGVVARDYQLTRQVRRREERMIAEFPTVAELLALSVSAGEGAVGALERVARTCGGELSAELRRTLADARAGASLVQALEGLAARTSLVSLARFVDGVAVAVERGTPLADVLRAQAQDVRDLGRRRLMETGGKKEIAMMVPVVFLVLPVTVLFAVYPGLAVLSVDL
ncbi:MAG: type II secretion system F family protein [Actinomycetes bacterium]